MTLVNFSLRRVLTAAVLVAVATFSLVGCGSGATQTRPPGSLYVSANNLVFVEARVDAPADQPFALYFENLEAIPHNVNVADATGASRARGEVFNGPAGQTLQVPALAAGTYKLLCDVHPDMTAELVAN